MNSSEAERALLFFYQLSLSALSTSIVSGAVAERCNFRSFLAYSVINVLGIALDTFLISGILLASLMKQTKFLKEERFWGFCRMCELFRQCSRCPRGGSGPRPAGCGSSGRWTWPAAAPSTWWAGSPRWWPRSTSDPAPAGGHTVYLKTNNNVPMICTARRRGRRW